MEENDTLVYCKILLLEEFVQICRCCLSQKPLGSIFEILYEGTPLANILGSVFGIQVDSEDGLPKKVCQTCVGEILRSYIFKKRYEASEVALRNTIPIKIEDDESERRSEGPENNVEELGDIQLIEETIPDCKESETCNNTEESETCSNTEESKICNITEKNLKQTANKMKQTQSRKFKCSCGETFASRLEFRQHRDLTSHQIPRTHPCKVCGKLCTAQSLWVHTRIHDAVKRYCCNYCTMRFSASGNLQRHIKQHTGERQFLCEFCGKSFIQHDSLATHRRIHTGENPYLCNVCGKTFRDKLNCKVHIRSHNAQKSLIKKRDSTKKNHKETIECVECGRTCYNQLGYKLHLFNKHGLGDQQATEEGKNQCQICKKFFATKSSLCFHKLTHKDEKRFLCNECGKSCRTSGALKSHSLVHSGEKPYKCEVCGKKFARQHGLQTHMLGHTGDKPFACNLCPKKFRQGTHLSTHLKTHTGERPFICTFCGKSFPHKYTHIVHVRMHTGERPFKCNVCEDTFYDSGSLKKHKQRKHRTT